MDAPTTFSTGQRRVTPVQYSPPTGYALDVEVIRDEELRRRVAMIDQRGIERVDFHVLLFVTSGTYTHVVDFETVECSPGSCVVIQPGQVHRFGTEDDWTGWLLVVRSSLFPPEIGAGAVGPLDFFRQLHALPTHIPTGGSVLEAVIEIFERMEMDTAMTAELNPLNHLLRSQCRLLFTRLHLAVEDAPLGPRVEPILLERFRAFRTSVEENFRRWHTVAPYAYDLGCSNKTLNRASLAVADLTAKAFLVDRIVLEAKRLLAHTLLNVSAISSELGFDEPTNFVKFFRRETGVTPGAFRTGHAG